MAPRPYPVHRVHEVVAKRLSRLLPPPKPPVRSEVLESIQTGAAMRRAAERAVLAELARNAPQSHVVLPSGRVVPYRPIPVLQPGTFPPGWADVHSDEYAHPGGE